MQVQDQDYHDLGVASLFVTLTLEQFLWKKKRNVYHNVFTDEKDQSQWCEIKSLFICIVCKNIICSLADTHILWDSWFTTSYREQYNFTVHRKQGRISVIFTSVWFLIDTYLQLLKCSCYAKMEKRKYCTWLSHTRLVSFKSQYYFSLKTNYIFYNITRLESSIFSKSRNSIYFISIYIYIELGLT